MSQLQKLPYIYEAEHLKEIHEKENPEYVYDPNLARKIKKQKKIMG